MEQILSILIIIICLSALILLFIFNLTSHIYQHKNKFGLILSLIFLLSSATLIILYNFVFKDDKTFGYITYIYLAFAILLVGLHQIIIKIREGKKIYNEQEFIDSLNKTNFNIYFLCDKKDRIKVISLGFLSELGLKEEEVIGKKAFDVFDKKIRFTKVNGENVTNKTLREYYKNYKKTNNGEEKKEIYLQNMEGETILLNLVEKPLYIGKSYYGRLDIGQKKTSDTMLEVERELSNQEKELNSIRYKFIASLELTDEAIFFNDLNDNSIWGNDIWAKELGINGNTISILDYKTLIFEDDRSFYVSKLRELTASNPTYEMRYRLRINGSYQFIYEKGKRIFEDPNSNVILGFAKRIGANYFERTNISIIDNVLDMAAMHNDLKGLFDKRHIFELVCINLTNLPEINEQYGRDVGNIVMGEYLKKIKLNFESESSNLYRKGGLVYFLTITDPRKMELFKRSIASNANALDMSIMVGGVKVTLEVNIGIAESVADGVNKEELIENVTKAINRSLDKNYKTNVVYYKDIKNVGIR